MKKTAQKLTLSRETLRRLENASLENAAGGVTHVSCTDQQTQTCVWTCVGFGC